MLGGILFSSFRTDSIHFANDPTNGKYDYYLVEAGRLRDEGQYTASFQMLQHCLALRPDAPSALFELSQYYMALNRPEQAGAALQKAVATRPDNYWYADALSDYYYRTGQIDQAIVLLDSMLIRFPTRQEPLMNLLAVYQQKGDTDKQIKILDELEQKMGQSEYLSMMKYQLYQQKKDTLHAFAELQDLITRYPTEMRYRTMLGDAYLQVSQPERALDLYQHVLAAEPHNIPALFSMAGYYRYVGDTDRYNLQVDSLLLNKDVPIDRKEEMMRMLVIQDNGSNGRDSLRIRRLFDDMVASNPEDSIIPTLYVQYLYSTKRETAAVPVLKHLLRINPANDAARMTLLQQAVQANDTDAVIRICGPGFRLNPTEVRYAYYLGISYYQKDSLT
ncbi:MAG: tetratricopeptide repeat protein, partial [Prevotellaceae bacterium]|nr:tetratricopeptide repeat protein [Prevotellaceae bacterium]